MSAGILRNDRLSGVRFGAGALLGIFAVGCCFLFGAHLALFGKFNGDL